MPRTDRHTLQVNDSPDVVRVHSIHEERNNTCLVLRGANEIQARDATQLFVGVLQHRRFVCLNASAFPAEPMGPGEPCTGPGGCEHGLLCRPGTTVSGCTEDSCCAVVCDETEMQGCDAGESCTPIIDDPLIGSEALGVCTPT